MSLLIAIAIGLSLLAFIISVAIAYYMNDLTRIVYYHIFYESHRHLTKKANHRSAQDGQRNQEYTNGTSQSDQG